jgi:tubulin epsilon
LALQDEYPGTLRFSVPVLPSADDDVVTSPYNAVLAAAALARAASAALPLDNAALAAAAARIEAAAAAGHTRSAHTAPVAAAAAAVSGDGSAAAARSGAARAWGTMNGLAASLLLHLTSSVRFEGSLNTDLSDITVNLVSSRLHHNAA